MNDRVFLDTNILIYAMAQDDPRGEIARDLLSKGGKVGVQVLNEFVSVARRKFDMAWDEIAQALGDIRVLCGEPAALDVGVHDAAMDLASRHRFGIYDALIVSAALAASCEVLYTEDLQHGQVFEGRLTVRNPFLAA